MDAVPDDMLISVLMPYYNDGRYVHAALDGLVNQTTAANLEILLVNDGSDQENTNTFLHLEEAYQGKFERFETFSFSENAGTNGALNKISDKIGDSFLAMVADADDILLPEYIDKVGSALLTANQEDPRVLMAYSDDLLIDESAEYIIGTGGKPFDRDLYQTENFVPGNAITFTEQFKPIFPLDPQYKAGNKHHRHLRTMGDNGLAVHVPEYLFLYRQHENQVSAHYEQLMQTGQVGDETLRLLPQEKWHTLDLTNIPHVDHGKLWKRTQA